MIRYQLKGVLKLLQIVQKSANRMKAAPARLLF